MIRSIIALIFLTCGAYSQAQQLPGLHFPQELPDSAIFKSKAQNPFDIGPIHFSQVPSLQSLNTFLENIPKITLTQQTPILQIEIHQLPINTHGQGVGQALLFDPYLFSEELLELPAIDD